MPACNEPSAALVLMSYVSHPCFPLVCCDDVLTLELRMGSYTTPRRHAMNFPGGFLRVLRVY